MGFHMTRVCTLASKSHIALLALIKDFLIYRLHTAISTSILLMLWLLLLLQMGLEVGMLLELLRMLEWMMRLVRKFNLNIMKKTLVL